MTLSRKRPAERTARSSNHMRAVDKPKFISNLCDEPIAVDHLPASIPLYRKVDGRVKDRNLGSIEVRKRAGESLRMWKEQRTPADVVPAARDRMLDSGKQRAMVVVQTLPLPAQSERTRMPLDEQASE
jgi:hypothetical protein